MHRTILSLAVVLPAIFVMNACGPTSAPVPKANQQHAAGKPIDQPLPPLRLPVPAPMPEQLDGESLKMMDAEELLRRASQASVWLDNSRAAAVGYWYVQKSGQGRYDLACLLTRIGQTEAALYWLQLAALEEGVDPVQAQREQDFDSLRHDPRWAKLHEYILACNRYFEVAPLARTALILPTGYRKVTPIPAVLWLHGYGASPEDFVNEGCQELADKLNVAFIGVSGTDVKNLRGFAWADDPGADAKRVRDALAEVGDRVTIERGKVVLFGFSQGAQVGLELAIRHPEEYAGAIVVSPGARSQLDFVNISPLLNHRGFVLVCGAKEHRGTVRLTAQDAAWLRQAKAQVIHKAYPGVTRHSLPVDFCERFPEWATFILKTRGK